jgi:hypothetical protein
MPVYFCDLHSPWPRRANENTNGLLRHYFLKGTYLSFSLIGSTTKGLTVKAALDDTVYRKGIKVEDRELAALPIRSHEFHGDWSYTVGPPTA